MTATRILMIDDDEDFLAMIALRLRAFGYDLLTASEPEEGIRLARSERPDLIILDLYMPHLDGYEVAKLLLADETTRNIPFIVLSSAEAERFRKKSLDWGADAFVNKRALELSTYLRQTSTADAVPMARKDQLDLTLLKRAIEKALSGGGVSS